METAMSQTILLTVDYHDQNCVIRRRVVGRTEDQLVTVATTAEDLRAVVDRARTAVGRGGRVVWLQESTTGWARVKATLGDQVEFLLANVLQMPLPPKGRRRKTDKVDTARLQREYLNGELPLAHQPPGWWRQVRRLVGHRESLVARRTAVRNWINRYLAHESWADRSGLWSGKGRLRLRELLSGQPGCDAFVAVAKLDELEQLDEALTATAAAFQAVYEQFPEARRLDAVRGIGLIGAVSIAARIGPVARFRTAEQLIAYAGLAPGVRQSDQTRHEGRIGGGGTDRQLRHYLIEASVWARQVPRYQPTYTRTAKRRGAKIGRLVVARMLLRSIFKVLKDGVAFEPEAATPGSAAETAPAVEAMAPAVA
jgi:transposase